MVGTFVSTIILSLHPNRNRRFSCYPSFPLKCSRTSLTTVPDSRNSAIRFGIAIKPLKVSATLHSNPKSAVAPSIATSEMCIRDSIYSCDTDNASYLWNKCIISNYCADAPFLFTVYFLSLIHISPCRAITLAMGISHGQKPTTAVIPMPMR